MRRVLLVVLALALASPVFAADCAWSPVSGASRSVTGTGAVNCTLTVASASATAGLNLSGVGGFSVRVCADSGQTITTAFSLSAYVQDAYTLIWARSKDWDLVGTLTGDRCYQIGGWQVVSPAGRVAYAPSAGAVSSGSVTIHLKATNLAGERI
jgi:hypothetical protein